MYTWISVGVYYVLLSKPDTTNTPETNPPEISNDTFYMTGLMQF